MLARHGHHVARLDFDNESIVGLTAKVGAAASSFYSQGSKARVDSTLNSFRPDVLHVHNFLPTLSPSVFFAAAEANVPVVQTLHNYRMVCANAQLFREGKVCELCVEKQSFLPGVQHACYRGSSFGSAVVGGTMALHASLGTWDKRVSRYIALTEFAARKLGAFRVPIQKIRIKPNFVPDGGLGDGAGGYALFVGRLSPEKGLETILEADRIDQLPMPVYLVGDGPMRLAVEQASAREGSRLVFLGPKSEAEVRTAMKAAAVLLVPSLWYEGFPMVMVEALSLGLPVIAARIGSLPEIIEDGVCGLLFEPANGPALAEAIRECARMPPERIAGMRSAARTRYLNRYAEAANYETLMVIYAEALDTPRPA